MEDTRINRAALRRVRDGEVKWRQAAPPGPVPTRPAGFAPVAATHLKPAMLVALWQLLHDQLIQVEDASVSLTASGVDLLSEWDSARAGAS
jgi:hypothetical protein